MEIRDSVAFVTGANRGLGLAFARELLGRGAKKVYAGIRNPVANSLPGIVPVKVDVTDPASVSTAAAHCGDVTLLINNAGIGRVNAGALDPAVIESACEIFETNFYGMVRVSQAFAPVLLANGGGAIINVLSDATWFARPVLTAYSASKSAAWSFTNALRIELRENGIQVLALHVGFLDTDMAKGLDVKKSDPQQVASRALDALENGSEEVLADAQSNAVKRSLSSDQAYYLDPPDLFV
ncbi:MAG: Short-chain dehydrogenase of various substrate specificity [Rhodospirillales bacterium]|jgi:NAD(P)-dependent dehydrogenase (short-subunit alcohol dehydrogenase family)|nr:Short-chain dehydrogenase of various substrate specificity [Rhodospirillales bacterium]